VPRTPREGVINATVWFLAVAVPGAGADRLVLDGWICSGEGVAANSVGQHGLVLCPVLVLSNKVPRGFAIQVLPAPVYIARHLGSSPRLAHFHDQTVRGSGGGFGSHRVDDSCVERWTSALVDYRLGVEFAGVVSGRDFLEIRPSRGTSVKRQRPLDDRQDCVENRTMRVAG